MSNPIAFNSPSNTWIPWISHIRAQVRVLANAIPFVYNELLSSLLKESSIKTQFSIIFWYTRLCCRKNLCFKTKSLFLSHALHTCCTQPGHPLSWSLRDPDWESSHHPEHCQSPWMGKRKLWGVSRQQWMPPPRSDPHHFLSQPSASTSDMASPNQQGAGKHSPGECSPTTCLESQARNTWQTGLTITPHPLRSFPCCPRQSCRVTSSPLGTFCVFFGHDNDHIAL